MLAHLREYQEVFPYLCSKILPPNPNCADHIHLLIFFMYGSMSKESFAPLLMASFPHDVWMALWEAYGDTNIPPFPRDIISLAASILVSSILDEIPPPDTPINFTNPVLSTNASDSVQPEKSCLPTLASWDDFLPDMQRCS